MRRLSHSAFVLVAVVVLSGRQPAPHAQTAQEYQALTFYVGAHQDDWELFHGNAAMNDIATSDKRVVFIYASAGDAGRTDGWWEARERGAVAAVRSAIGAAPLTMDYVRANGHPVLRYRTRNSASYFLRLPDGKFREGLGYPSTNNESLSQLRDTGKAVTAVDKSTTYQTWSDFRQTLQAIMDTERLLVPGDVHPWVNAPDYFGADNSHPDCQNAETCNSCDHPDHKAVADALRQFVSGTFSRRWWVGYETRNRPENLNAPDLLLKAKAFLAYSTAVQDETTANGTPAIADLVEWTSWGGRDYFRTVSWDQPDPDTPACTGQ